jgi:hypothetical protein
MMRWATALLIAIVAAACPAAAQSFKLPTNATAYLPLLRDVQRQSWADAPYPSFLAAQVEQETCPSLTSSKCWNPRTELKMAREYGFGLGQTTVAYRKNGSIRFDKQAELREQYGSLREWTWARRFEPKYQLTALVEMDHGIYKHVTGAASRLDQLAFTLSGYNGGESGVRQDRLLCRNTDGCEPSRWFGNVELYSLKTKTAFKGYGQSPYRINRDYVQNVINVRRPKYEPYFGDPEK